MTTCSRWKGRKLILAISLTLSLTFSWLGGCTPQRKPEDQLPNVPPNTNRAPLPRDPQLTARGLAGTAQQTPGIQQAWGLAHDRTVVLGVYLQPGLSEAEAHQVKVAAVGRALDATTQLVIIKITDDPEKVEKIKAISQALRRGDRSDHYQEEIEKLSAEIPAIDPQRPR